MANSETTEGQHYENEPILNVMTANVCGPYGFEVRKEAAFEVFKQEYDKSTADLVGFQELSPGNWEEVFSKARPDLDLVPGEQIDDFVIVNPFAYKRERFELLQHGTIWLSPDQTKQKVAWDSVDIARAMTWGILVDRTNGRKFLFVNIHPDNKGRTARQESFRMVLEHVEGLSLPTILTADSNISVHSPNQEIWSEKDMRAPYDVLLNAGFRDAWREAHPKELRPCTFHNNRGPRYSAVRHDGFGTADTEWIMYRGPFQTVEAWVVTDRHKGIYPSDHFWMQALLRWVN